MNQELKELIKDFAIKKHDDIHNNLLGKSRSNLIAILLDLLTTYFNDLNSSTMRELVVALVAEYEPNEEKLGYNGYRQNTLTGKVEHCEIKPSNVRRDSTAKTPKKLDGGGNFTDYGWKKFKRHKEENPKMLTAGFVDGQLVYILKFSFNEPSFTSRLEEQLKHRFPNGDISGQYLRSASFTFNHYKDVDSLEPIFILPIQERYKLKVHMTGTFFQYLEWLSR